MTDITGVATALDTFPDRNGRGHWITAHVDDGSTSGKHVEFRVEPDTYADFAEDVDRNVAMDDAGGCAIDDHDRHRDEREAAA